MAFALGSLSELRVAPVLPAVRMGMAHAAGVFRMHSQQFQSRDFHFHFSQSVAFGLKSQDVGGAGVIDESYRRSKDELYLRAVGWNLVELFLYMQCIEANYRSIEADLVLTFVRIVHGDGVSE